MDGTSYTKARCATFDIAKVLKIIILPSIVSCCIIHNLKSFSISYHKSREVLISF